MLTRQRYREVPPRVDYELTPRARDLFPVLAELAKWGYEWAWSAPRSGERVDIGAIFRLAGGLISTTPSAASLQFTVSDASDEDGPATFTVNLGPSEVSVVEQPAVEPAATATASTAAWVRAFGPSPDLSGLDIAGDRALIENLLHELAQESIQVAAAERADQELELEQHAA